MGDPSFAHRAGDGLHRRAQRVEQRGQLPGALRLPALLHHEAGHGDHVGVEGSPVRHGGRRSSCGPGAEVGGNAAGLKCAARRNQAEGVRDAGPIRGCVRGVAAVGTLTRIVQNFLEVTN